MPIFMHIDVSARRRPSPTWGPCHTPPKNVGWFTHPPWSRVTASPAPPGRPAGPRDDRPTAGHLDALTRHLPVGVVRFDLQGRHLYLNAAAERIAGHPAAALLGRTHAELGAPPLLTAAIAGCLEHARAGRSSVCQVAHPPATGESEALHLEGTPETHPDGTPSGLLLVARPSPRDPDAWRQLVEHAPDGVLALLTADGTLQVSGGDPAVLFPGSAAAHAPHPTLQALFPAPLRDRVARAVGRALAGEPVSIQLSHEGQAWDLRLAPAAPSASGLPRAAVQLHDATHEQSRMREAHHRVKNHLALACSLLRLEAGRLSGPAREALIRSEERLRSFAVLYERLSRTPGGHRLAAGPWLEGLLAPWERLLAPGQLQVEADELLLPDEVALPLGLVLNELVSNAVEHAVLPTGCDLRVSLRACHGGVLLQIADDGPGYPEGIEGHAGRLGSSLVGLFTRRMGATLTRSGPPGLTVDVWAPLPGSAS